MLYRELQLLRYLISENAVKICMLLTNTNITTDILASQKIRIGDSAQYKLGTLIKSVVALVAISLLLQESVIILNLLDGLLSNQSSLFDIAGSPYFWNF